MKKRFGAFVALFVIVGALPVLPARAATTYEIVVGQDFFETGVPGFSARFYPGSVKVQQGDTLHFNQGPGLGPAGLYPQEYFGENGVNIGDPAFFFVFDPDEGPDAIKFNPLFDTPPTCGTADNPCVWDNSTNEIVFAGSEQGDAFVTVNALPGTTMWAAGALGSDANVNFKVEVVGPNETASTQAELDSRAESLMEKDAEDAAALHHRMSAKESFHENRAGDKVYDVFVGAAAGPIELFASYPKKTSIRKGDKVQFHYMSQIEPHTATFGGNQARNLFQNGFQPVCDPDGDTGTAADNPAQFEDPEAPPCADMTQFEVDVDRRVVDEVGNGRVSDNSTLESSGLKGVQFPDGGFLNANPWTVRFDKANNDEGYKFICLLHGGFMGGKVLVK